MILDQSKERERERYRQMSPDPGEPDCSACGAFLPIEFHEDGCPFVEEMKKEGR